MAVELPDDFDINQLDMADPATREFAKGLVDLDDPETKKWWDSTAPKAVTPTPEKKGGLGESFGKGVRGVLQGAGALTDIVSGPVAAGANWATGSNFNVSPGHEAGKWLADQLGLAVPETDMEELANAINEGGIQGLLSAGAGMAASGAKGVVGTVGKALADSPLLDTLSGMASGASGKLAEQAGAGPWGQMGAALGGGLSPFALKALGGRLYKAITDDGMVPESDFVRDLFIERGRDTTPKADPRVPLENVDLGAGGRLDLWRPDHAGGVRLDDEVTFGSQLQKDAEAFQNRPKDTTPLEAEAAAFKPKPEPEVTDLFPTEESLAAKSKAMEEKLVAERDAFLNRDETVEAKPVEAEAPVAVSDAKPFTGTDKTVDIEDDLPQNVKDIVDHTDELTAKWQNSPEVIVYDHFDDFDELDPGSLGVYNPEDGKVYLNANAIDKEAKFRGLTQKEMTNTVLFHEGLGHFGLAQKFRDDLDATLTGFYDESPFFRKKVNAWIKKNPESYKDEDTVVRAGEEILAEMSEAGRMPATFINKIKNQIKDYARQLGIKLDFSEREIKTILAQVHEAVINGKGADVRGNGYRAMSPDRIRPEPEAAKTFLKELGLFGNKELSDMLPEEAINRASRIGIDREWLDYFENRRRISQGSKEDKLPQPDLKKYMPDINLKRPMKSTFGESKGPLQGPASKEDAEPSTINKFRSNRNIEDIMEEAAPTKTKESWEEWIDSADRTKMTGQIASSLAKGVEVPELLAAQQFAVKSANRIYDLSRKAANGNATERDIALLGKEMTRLEDVSEAITNVVTNAARILNSRKIEVGSDKALADQIRKMLATADLTTPEGVEAAAKKIVQDQKKARILHKALNVLGNIVNLPFTMLSSYDLSAPLRQGRTQMHTKEFWQGIAPMFKMAFSENTFQKTMDEIKTRPNYKLMDRAGLALTDLGDDLTNREDRFLSKWAEKLPGVRGSARAYTGFLNKLRADTFDSLVKSQKDAGIDIEKNAATLKEIAGFINNATGRGNLGKFSQSAPILTGVFFSPRLIASRVAMLNPAYYVKLSPPVRKEALKSLLSLGTTTATVAGLAAMAGADIETDPRSSDFMKIKTGNTRYDIMGGFGQYLTLGARLATNETKNSKGDIVELGKKFGSSTRWDVGMQFLSNKFSPVAGFVRDYLKGKDAVGEPFDATTATLKMFIPLFAQDTYDLMQERGAVEGAVRSVPGFFGAGASTYPGPKGFDEYGRAYDSDREDDPVVSEVKRLQDMTPDETFLNPVRGTVTIDGKRVKLPDDILYEYQKLAGENVMSDLKAEIEQPEWDDYTDEDKIEIIKEIARDARKDARAELFGELEEGELDDTENGG